jgi:hypothetical protein
VPPPRASTRTAVWAIVEEPRRLGVVNAAFAGQVTGSINANGPNIREQFNNAFIVGAVASNDQGGARLASHFARAA